MPVISPAKIRYIKLGEGGTWTQSCIEDGTICLGYESPFHEQSLRGEWEIVRDYWLKRRNGNQKTASNDLRQIRDFYELGEDDVWVTFHKGKLYWCKVFKEVIELEDESRIRSVIGKWSSTDKNGRELRIENLDGRLTQVRGFRGTICSLDYHRDYLIRKINGETIPDVKETEETLQQLKSNIAKLIHGLWWPDFELLIDLVFARSGWQRFSVLGKTEKDIDLDVYLPTSQTRAFVQIKSATTASEMKKSIDAYEAYEQFHEMYFVYHSCNDSLDEFQDMEDVHVLGVEKIADLVVNVGLVEWLISKRS